MRCTHLSSGLGLLVFAFFIVHHMANTLLLDVNVNLILGGAYYASECSGFPYND